MIHREVAEVCMPTGWYFTIVLTQNVKKSIDDDWSIGLRGTIMTIMHVVDSLKFSEVVYTVLPVLSRIDLNALYTQILYLSESQKEM